MRSTFDEVLIELQDLRALVESVAPVNLALRGHKDTVVQKYMSIRRRFDYAAFTVALYASFEKFVENLITAYVRLETQRVKYAALPEKLQTKHLAGTAELLSRGRIGEGRYRGMTHMGAVKNLNDCLSGTTPYSLNEPVVATHDSNLRTKIVDELFAAVGIDSICSRACRGDAVVDWFCKVKELATPPPAGVPLTVVSTRLDDIVDRRNQVAHRGGSQDNLQGEGEMKEAVEFITSFATSVFGLVVGRYLATRYDSPANCIEMTLLQTRSYLSKGKIVIVNKPAQRIFVNQPVFVEMGTNGARWGRIQSLRVNDADVPALEADATAPDGVGVRLDFKFPKQQGAKLVALYEDDDVVWPAQTGGPAAMGDA